MTYNGNDISKMTIKQLNEANSEIWKQLARVRGHKLRDRLHKQRYEIELMLKCK